MLRHLHIRNLALVEEIALDFEPGMTVITGETGTGKSIILDGIGLLTGARATPSLVRSGARRATVEAVFEIAPDSPAGLLLESWDNPPEDGSHEVILSREILASGRSRATINGRLVPLTQFETLGAHLLEVGGQHDQHALLQPNNQQAFFDDHAGLADLLGSHAASFRSAQETARALASSAQEQFHREQRRDFLRFQTEELENLSLKPGELAELEAERQRLAHLDELARLCQATLLLLADAPDGEQSATDLVGHATQHLEMMARHDHRMQAAAEGLSDIQARIADTCFELQRYADTLEPEPGRLDDVENRLTALRRVVRKYGTEHQALEHLRAIREELDLLENWEANAELARRAHHQALLALAESATRLRRAREIAVDGFTRPLQAMLREFAMPHAEVRVAFQPATGGLELPDGTRCGPLGGESLEILFSANPGEAPKPLGRVASGGELSRLMLALRTLTVTTANAPLLVFDEIDAGISGTAARCVAERMAALGERCQLLCVTHNPSVASASRHHILVEKAVHEGRTSTSARRIEGNARKEELARLLDGGQVTRQGMALAGEMLRQAV